MPGGARTASGSHLVLSLDQGTSSTRCMLFDLSGNPVAAHQLEHDQRYPRPGWVEHDAVEIWQRSLECIRGAMKAAGAEASGIAAVGVTNQRETAVVWERSTGLPVANAIVWQDTRTDEMCRQLAHEHGGTFGLQAKTGLPISTYSAGPKVAWLLDHGEDRRAAAERGELLFGTIDSWLIWNLTGGPDRGVHVTDPSNASRTMLMNLSTLEWDDELMDLLRVPRAMLPEIRSSSEPYGRCTGELAGVKVAGDLGDQQAALFGQCCFEPGEVKNTYGTGCFLLMNTGAAPVLSTNGLITTVASRLGGAPPSFALEGSVAVAGALVQWLRDNLGIIDRAADVEALAGTVPDSGGVVFVPAFSGLFAPHWRADARGVIAGLTRFANRGHIARAALEASAYQTLELFEAMRADTGLSPPVLRVDGGMTDNELLMQLQADVLGVPVSKLGIAEVTALGAAYAAGLAVGFWGEPEELRSNHGEARRWEPSMDEEARSGGIERWRKGVARSLDWVD